MAQTTLAALDTAPLSHIATQTKPSCVQTETRGAAPTARDSKWLSTGLMATPPVGAGAQELMAEAQPAGSDHKG